MINSIACNLESLIDACKGNLAGMVTVYFKKQTLQTRLWQ